MPCLHACRLSRANTAFEISQPECRREDRAAAFQPSFHLSQSTGHADDCRDYWLSPGESLTDTEGHW